MTILMPSPTPYIVLFALITIVALACLVKFSSLRKYRRKRNLLVYGFIALLLSLTGYQAANIAHEAYTGPMMVTYDIEYNGNPLYAGQTSQFTVCCENLGKQETSFYLVLNSQNASLLADNHQGYIQTNSTSIKIPFTLHTVHEKVTATVHFRIDENAASSKFYPQIERTGHSPIVTGATATVECFLNAKTNSYNFTAVPGPCV